MVRDKRGSLDQQDRKWRVKACTYIKGRLPSIAFFAASSLTKKIPIVGKVVLVCDLVYSTTNASRNYMVAENQNSKVFFGGNLIVSLVRVIKFLI
jgi:hypothetical protein